MRLISKFLNPRQVPCLVAITLTIAACSSISAHADEMADGKRFYGLQDYNKAALSFQKAVAKNGRDAMAHYYLGHCYVAKRDYGEARAEYQYTADLTKDSKVREYCENLVASLEARHAGLRGTSARGSNGGNRGHSNGAGDMSISDADSIRDRADRDCERLRAEKGAELARYSGTDRLNEIDQINSRYDERMRVIQEEANNRTHRIDR